MNSRNFATLLSRFLIGFSLFYLVACTPEDEKINPNTGISKGVYVVNKGINVGTLSLYDSASNTIQNDVFEKANSGVTIGNAFQSMSFIDDKAYLVASLSNKINVVDGKTFQLSRTITGFEQPRYILPGGARAFVSQWGKDGLTGSIQIIDIATAAIVKSISVGKGAERIGYVNSKLWVLNSGGLGQDSTITVVDIFNNVDTIVKTIAVSPGPNSLVLDANGDAWVLCGSYSNKNGGGKLLKINRTEKIELSFDVPSLASNLVIDKSGYSIYFIANNKIWYKDIQNFGKTPPSVLNISKAFQSPNALGINPTTGNIFCGDALNSTSSGTLNIIDVKTLAIKDSLKIGIAPNAFIFR